MITKGALKDADWIETFDAGIRWESTFTANRERELVELGVLIPTGEPHLFVTAHRVETREETKEVHKWRFVGPVVVGEIVHVESWGEDEKGLVTYRTKAWGVYQGEKLDTWGSGEMYHYFKGGQIGETSQEGGLHGMCSSQLVNGDVAEQ